MVFGDVLFTAPLAQQRVLNEMDAEGRRQCPIFGPRKILYIDHVHVTLSFDVTHYTDY